MRLLIAAGGTGGHIYPALAVARSLDANPDAPELRWIGGHRGLESSLVPAAGIPLRRLTARSLRTTEAEVHAVLEAVRNYASTALDALLGGHTVDFWTVWGPWVDLASGLAFEPLRLCLLAVAFRRCLELFQQRPHAIARAGATAPATAVVAG